MPRGLPRWFGPRRFGIGLGASPRGWQGWLVAAILVGGAVGVEYVPPDLLPANVTSFDVTIGLLFAYLLVIFLTYGRDPD